MAVVTSSTIDRMVARARFHLRMARGLQLTFLTVLLGTGLFSPIGISLGQMDIGILLIVVIGLCWFLLVMRSLQQGSLMRQAVLLISQNRAPQAVPFLALTIEQFSIFRLPKIIALYHLMQLAYARQDHATAARLASEIIRYRLARRKGLTRHASLILADSLMELGDADAAGQSLSCLHGQKLTVSERLQLLPILLRWQMLHGKYTEAVQHLEEKVQLAALLNCRQACLVHVLLAAAACHCGMLDISHFLLRRAGLHYDLRTLAQDNPSAASCLVQLQGTEQDRLTGGNGRTAYAQAASLAVSQDVQSEKGSTATLGEHECPADTRCDICTRP